MGSVRISVEELEKSAAFVRFSSGKMDHLHRFPAELRAVGDRYIVPMVVAIGPYHRGKDHLRNMEEVKRAATYHFSQGNHSVALEKVHGAVLSVAGRARRLYAGDAVVDMEDGDFGEMMFFDACFLLQYMEAYLSFGSSEGTSEDRELRRLLFTNRACINNDIMLQENQLPWLVLETIINSLEENRKRHYLKVVWEFIRDMGKTFEIVEDVDEDTSIFSDNNNSPPLARPPPHLLGLLRRHKIEPGTNELEWPKVDRFSEFSAIELAEIGIKLKASKTALFTDMNIRKRGPLCGELSLAPLSLNSTTACWLVNMAAFEVSTSETFQDDPNNTAVCSYLALLSIFMHQEEDVHELRAKRILKGHHTNAEMLTFFKEVIKLLPDTGCLFANIMMHIEKYKESRRTRTKVHQVVYNNLSTIIPSTIIPVVTIIGTLVGIFQALQSFNQGQKNDTP